MATIGFVENLPMGEFCSECSALDPVEISRNVKVADCFSRCHLV